MTNQVHQAEDKSKPSSQRGPAKPASQGPVAPAPQLSSLALQRAIADPRAASPRDILALQRAAGNRAVARLIQSFGGLRMQAKLTVGPAGDRYEQEADRVANQVVSGQLSAVSSQRSAVSRQPEEEEEIQTKPLAASITPLVQRQEDEDEIQTKSNLQSSISSAIPSLQRAAAGPGGGPAVPWVGAVHHAPVGLPDITGLPAQTQTLLQGVLQMNTINAAVRQMYDNLWNLSGWVYRASAAGSNGLAYINGTKNEGMCQSFREGFMALLRIYDGLRAHHPSLAVRNGALDFRRDDALANERFMTRRGLTLIGPSRLRGNVTLEIDGNGNVVDRGIDSINRFVFAYHWKVAVNGVEYDPIFYSIGEDNTGVMFNYRYEGSGLKALANREVPTPGNEFGTTFVIVDNFAAYNALKASIQTFYDTHRPAIDALLEGRQPVTGPGGGWKVGLRTGGGLNELTESRRAYSKAAQAVLSPITGIGAFAKVIAIEGKTQPTALSFLQVLRKVAQLAGRPIP